MHMTIIYIGI